jgi:hypothetical protein
VSPDMQTLVFSNDPLLVTYLLLPTKFLSLGSFQKQ